MTQPDISVYSPTGELQLVVEVKQRKGATVEWARHLRRNLVTHRLLPSARFFLLALPDRLFLWKDKASVPDAPPDHEASTLDTLGLYLGDWKIEELTEESFELLLKSWLSDLVRAELSATAAPQELRWVLDSGLYASIRDGYVDRLSVA